jgi:hypothetical protein
MQLPFERRSLRDKSHRQGSCQVMVFHGVCCFRYRNRPAFRLRGFRINPRLSAHAQLYGTFDYNRTPLAPPGTLVFVHEKHSSRCTWAHHAGDGWYLGWFPTQFAMPTASSTDLAVVAARDLIHARLNPSPASRLSRVSDSQLAALEQLASIFAAVTNVLPWSTPSKHQQFPKNSPHFREYQQPTHLLYQPQQVSAHFRGCASPQLRG